MKKLALDLESLVVESFDTMDIGRERGTVHGRETHVSPCEPTAMTRCLGECGEYTQGGGITCYGCNHTETCTYNEYAAECQSYAVQCEPSMVPTNCPSEPTCYPYCRDSVTAC